MMTASPPLLIGKPVGITTGRQPLFGNNLKLRSNLTRIYGFKPPDAKFAVTKSSRSETHSPSQSMEPSKLHTNVSKSSPVTSEAMEEGIEKVIYRFRFLAILGVFGSLIGSFLCFIKGCTYVVSSFTEYFAHGGKVVLLLVEAIDLYLLGTVMLVFGMGLYELFVSNLSIAKSVSMENVQQSNLFGLFTLKQHSQLIAASRSLMFHPPAIPRASLMKKPVSPPAIDFDWFTKNRYKTLEADAFRPTSPGNSPGAGHKEPPGFYP